MQASSIIISPRLRAPRGGLTVAGRDYRGGVFLPPSARPILEALAVKAARVSVADPVVIGIHGFGYRLRSIPILASVGTVAFELIPTDKPTQTHHVMRENSGEVVCTCGDFVFRKAGTGEMCKHGRRLAELGLIPSTPPRILPPFAQRAEVAEVALPEPWVAPTPSYSSRFEPTSAELAEWLGFQLGSEGIAADLVSPGATERTAFERGLVAGDGLLMDSLIGEDPERYAPETVARS